MATGICCHERVFEALRHCIRRLAAADHERVLGGNAVAVYGLEGDG